MKTDVIEISREENNIENALTQIEKVVAYKDLSPENAVVLRLLTEEVMAMMRAITGNVNGQFWIEDQDGVYEIHLLVRTLVDDVMHNQLLSVSASGKNEATRGFMGKIRSFFEPYAGVSMFSAGFGGGTPQMYESYSWSMEDYREQLLQYRELEGRCDPEEWDELEKSVVARLADDVKVSIRGRNVEMTIIKKMS